MISHVSADEVDCLVSQLKSLISLDFSKLIFILDNYKHDMCTTEDGEMKQIRNDMIQMKADIMGMKINHPEQLSCVEQMKNKNNNLISLNQMNTDTNAQKIIPEMKNKDS